MTKIFIPYCKDKCAEKIITDLGYTFLNQEWHDGGCHITIYLTENLTEQNFDDFKTAYLNEHNKIEYEII